MPPSKTPSKTKKSPANSALKRPQRATLPNLAKKVGQALARHRSRAGLTQGKVAGLLGIEIETVSRLETGAIAATLSRLEQFARIYDCPVVAFFQDGSEDAESMAITLAEILRPLPDDERKLLVGFMVEAGRLFRQRTGKETYLA
jgi:transcriptional regulator with XRE-family HTH domain